MAHAYFRCPKCLVAHLVSGVQEELIRLPHLVEHMFRRCTTDRCTGTMAPGGPELLEGAKLASSLTAREFVAAVAGLGLPEEIDASVEVVEAIFKAYPVTGVKVERSTHNPKRSILTQLSL